MCSTACPALSRYNSQQGEPPYPNLCTTHPGQSRHREDRSKKRFFVAGHDTGARSFNAHGIQEQTGTIFAFYIATAVGGAIYFRGDTPERRAGDIHARL